VRRHPAQRNSSLIAAIAVCAAVLAACSSFPVGKDLGKGGTGEADQAGDPDVFDKIRSIDLLPRYPTQVRQDESPSGKPLRSAIYLGVSEPPPKRTAPGSTTSGNDGYDLNFENTPVASVAKVVLGDILGVGYIIDPRVQGTISLSSGRPIPKADVVFVLENALRLSGVALVRDNTGYRLMPQGDATGAGALDAAERAEPGYGISAVPLQYVSAPTLLKLIDSFATKPGMVRADPSRNMIIIQGSGTERRNAIDLVMSFDVDWMRGQSVGIFPVQQQSRADHRRAGEDLGFRRGRGCAGPGDPATDRPDECGARGQPQARSAASDRDLDPPPGQCRHRPLERPCLSIEVRRGAPGGAGPQ
jgi:hypothetical protein